MGAPKRYAPPHRQLGELMVEARRSGVTFEEFWIRAVRPEKWQTLVMVTDPDPPEGCVLWPTDPKDRKDWRAAILQTQDGWRRSFERTPASRPERAVAELAAVLDELDALRGGGGEEAFAAA